MAKSRMNPKLVFGLFLATSVGCLFPIQGQLVNAATISEKSETALQKSISIQVTDLNPNAIEIQESSDLLAQNRRRKKNRNNNSNNNSNSSCNSNSNSNSNNNSNNSSNSNSNN